MTALAWRILAAVCLLAAGVLIALGSDAPGPTPWAVGVVR
jgi:hypothetical protein